MKQQEEQKKVDDAQKIVDDAKKAEDEKAAMRRTSDLYRNAVQKSIAMANGDNNKVSFSSLAGEMSNSIIPDKQAEVPKAVEAQKQP